MTNSCLMALRSTRPSPEAVEGNASYVWRIWWIGAERKRGFNICIQFDCAFEGVIKIWTVTFEPSALWNFNISRCGRRHSSSESHSFRPRHFLVDRNKQTFEKERLIQPEENVSFPRLLMFTFPSKYRNNPSYCSTPFVPTPLFAVTWNVVMNILFFAE